MIKTLVLMAIVASTMSCPDENFCSSCNYKKGEAECLTCHNGFVFEKKCYQVEPENRIKNCVYYREKYSRDKYYSCEQCEVGFISVGYECISCKIEGCADCAYPQFCTGCFNGKVVSIQRLETKCVEGNNGFKNCNTTKSYLGLKSCILCNEGFSINPNEKNPDGVCVQTEIKDCISLAFDSLKSCGHCKPGFYVTVKGECVKNKESQMMSEE